MLKKTVLVTCFTAVSLNAAMFAGITDKGFDFGLGTDKIDFVLQGQFNYISADANYSGWTLSLSPNVEYRVFRTQRFKFYAMCGVFGVYGRYAPGNISLGPTPDLNNNLQAIAVGVNILILRPEAILSKNVSIYADIPVLQYEDGNQSGMNIWLIGGITDGLGYVGGSSPIALGIKFYF